MWKIVLCGIVSLIGPAALSLPSFLMTPSCCECPAPDLIQAEVVDPYVEVAASWSGTGSGTVIEVDGEVLILTAAHVVEGYADPVTEKFMDAEGKEQERPVKVSPRPAILVQYLEGKGVKVEAPIVWYSAPEEKGGNDFALLKPKDAKPFTAARLLLKDDLRAGEDVWYIGTPAGVHGRLERSIVAIRHMPALDRLWTATNGCGDFGSSGGGLYVVRGGHYCLAGVITRKANSRNPVSIKLAKTPSDIAAFLNSYRNRNKK